MHAADSEVVFDHFLGEPFNLAFGVAEYYSLSDGETVVQVAESVELPLFLIDSNKELFDTL